MIYFSLPTDPISFDEIVLLEFMIPSVAKYLPLDHFIMPVVGISNIIFVTFVACLRYICYKFMIIVRNICLLLNNASFWIILMFGVKIVVSWMNFMGFGRRMNYLHDIVVYFFYILINIIFLFSVLGFFWIHFHLERIKMKMN